MSTRPPRAGGEAKAIVSSRTGGRSVLGDSTSEQRVRVGEVRTPAFWESSSREARPSGRARVRQAPARASTRIHKRRTALARRQSTSRRGSPGDARIARGAHAFVVVPFVAALEWHGVCDTRLAGPAQALDEVPFCGWLVVVMVGFASTAPAVSCAPWRSGPGSSARGIARHQATARGLPLLSALCALRMLSAAVMAGNRVRLQALATVGAYSGAGRRSSGTSRPETRPQEATRPRRASRRTSLS